MADDYKYHIDHHGSMVRPAALLAAADFETAAFETAAFETAAFETAAFETAAFETAASQAAVAVAHRLRRLTLSAVSDGQYRRSCLESVVYDQVTGFGPVTSATPLADAAGIPVSRRRAVSGSPPEPGRLAQREVAPVVATVDRPVFVQLPSPGYLAAVGSSLADVDAVRSTGAALASILRSEIAALRDDGVAYVALANPLYPPLLTVAGRAQLSAAGVDVPAVIS